MFHATRTTSKPTLMPHIDTTPRTPHTPRYTANAVELMLGEPVEAARGVALQLGVPHLELFERLSRGVRAIVEECDAHGSEEDKRWLRYVLEEPAGHHEGLMEAGRAGQMLEYFVKHPIAVAAGLEMVHVVALRWYTSPAFAALNGPLRRETAGAPHPFAATITFLAEGLRRLRAQACSEMSDGARQLDQVRIWRGMRNVTTPERIMQVGGTEKAMLSCTPKLASAAQFAASRTSLIFLITTRSFMQCGASLRFLSCFPHEEEYCYPPCTYLRPTGRWQRVELNGTQHCTVIEVTPHVGT